MVTPIVEDLLGLEMEGIIAYDAYLKQEVLALAPVLFILGGNFP